MVNERIIEQAAAYKKDARDLFERAVAALVALGFKYSSQGADFLWSSDPALDAEANRILRGMSDEAQARAKDRAMKVIEALEWDGEYAWEDSNNNGYVTILYRFDQQASFLKELMQTWLALAFVHGLTQSYLRISVIRYLGNPYASPLWSGLPRGLVSYGKGYARNLIEQIALIGQDGIISTVRYAQWRDAMNKDAKYWIWRRGSNFKCEECESQAGMAFPMDVRFDQMHARCMCYPEYHYEDLEV